MWTDVSHPLRTLSAKRERCTSLDLRTQTLLKYLSSLLIFMYTYIRKLCNIIKSIFPIFRITSSRSERDFVIKKDYLSVVENIIGAGKRFGLIIRGPMN